MERFGQGKGLEEPTVEESTVRSIVVQKIETMLPHQQEFQNVLDYFQVHSDSVMKHHLSDSKEAFTAWLSGKINFLPSAESDVISYCIGKLFHTITDAKETGQTAYYAEIRRKVCKNLVSNVNWNVVDKVKGYSTNARSWKVGEKGDETSLREYMKELAKLKSGAVKDKSPEYAAFTGSSGSGKTTAMIYSVINDIDADSTLKVYLQCGGTKSSPTKFLLGKKKLFHKTLQQAWNVATGAEDIAIPRDFWTGTTLVLILDEVPLNWVHDAYMELSKRLRDQFLGVVLFVGSTALSGTVLQQPTTPTSVIKVRMLTVAPQKAKELLKSRLEQSTHCDTWFEAFSLLPELLTNQRCAELTSEVLKPIIASVAANTPKEKTIEFFASMSPYVMLNVAQTYLGMNGMKDLGYERRIRLMAAALGLVSMQRAVKPTKDGSVELHSDDDYKKLAKGDEIAVYSKGLVDREMVGEGKKYFLEWTMSPALTLVCAVSLAPWFAELHNEPDKLEALGCLQWLSIRFIQTDKVWQLKRMSHAVPRTGQDAKTWEIDEETAQDKIFLNAPLAAFGDCMVAGAPPQKVIPPASLSTQTDDDPKTPVKNFVESLTQQKAGKGSAGSSGKGSAGSSGKGSAGSSGKGSAGPCSIKASSGSVKSFSTMILNSPHKAPANGNELRLAKIVQAKHTIEEQTTCDVTKEMAKAGFYDAKPENEKLAKPQTEHQDLSKRRTTKRRKLDTKQADDRENQIKRLEASCSAQEKKMEMYSELHQTGKPLIDQHFKDATMVFLTNAKFSEDNLASMESRGCLAVQGGRELKFGEPAWKSFYPFRQLSLAKSPANKTKRREVHFQKD